MSEIVEEDVKVLTDFLAQNLLARISKEEFLRDKALKNLTKSTASSLFFKELCELYEKFADNKITLEELADITKGLKEPDKSRFLIIVQVYENYLKTIEESGYVSYQRKDKKVPFGSPQNKAEKKFITFDDIYDEISFIAESIKEKVENKTANFSDFAVLIRNFDAKQKFIDLFKTFEVPVSCEAYSDNFQNFKRTLVRYLKICSVYEKLGIEEFSKAEFEKLQFLSKSKTEIYYEELNSYIESLLSEVLEDSYARDRFLMLQEQNKSFSLMSIISSNIDIVQDGDKEKLIGELKSLAGIFTLYKSSRYIELFSTLCTKYGIEKKSAGTLLGAVKSVQKLYKDVLKTALPLEVLVDLAQNAHEISTQNFDAVELCALSTEQSRKFVFLPCLTENTFPKKNNSTNFISPESNEAISSVLRASHSDFDEVIKTDKTHLNEERELFKNALQSAEAEITLSTHLYEEKKQCAPSVYYMQLAQESRISPLYIEKSAESQYLKPTAENEETYESAKVIGEDEELKLSPSAAKTFLKCPKKYYFKNLLNLKEPSVFAANYGNIVHSIMEVFYEKYFEKYSKETVLVLKDILFRSKEEPQTALDAGFSELSVELIKASDPLALAEMEQNFEDAVAEMDKNGWFCKKPASVATEKSFKFRHPDLPNVLLDGRIDAVVEENGYYKIIDYKTGQNVDMDLNYALSDFGLNFYTRTGKVPSNVEDYIRKQDFQIPLYYLATQNAKELAQYKGKVESLALEYIRPSTRNGGYLKDSIGAHRIESQKDKVIDNLKTTVVERIRGSEDFAKNLCRDCSNCGFTFLCENSQEGDDDE